MKKKSKASMEFAKEMDLIRKAQRIKGQGKCTNYIVELERFNDE